MLSGPVTLDLTARIMSSSVGRGDHQMRQFPRLLEQPAELGAVDARVCSAA